MIVTSNKETFANFATVRTKIIGKLLVSYTSLHEVSKYNFSLDERLDHMLTTTSLSRAITAEEAIDVIGEEAFQNMIYNVIEPTCYYQKIVTLTLRGILVEGFDWSKTQEGFDYWRNIYDKIIYP